MPVPSRSIVVGSGVADADGDSPGLNGGTTPTTGGGSADGAGPGSTATMGGEIDAAGAAAGGSATGAAGAAAGGAGLLPLLGCPDDCLG